MFDQDLSGLLAELADHSESNRVFQCSDRFVAVLREKPSRDSRIGSGAFENSQSARSTFFDRSERIVTRLHQDGLDPCGKFLDPFVGDFFREAANELLGKFLGHRHGALSP